MKTSTNTTVITHDGIFHSDEIIAISLLACKHENINIIRDRNYTSYEYDYIVDVGGNYSPENGQFDHHQTSYTGSLSAAGMVAKWIGCEHPMISNVDIRDNKGPGHCDPSWDKVFNLVRDCNTINIYSDHQDDVFLKIAEYFYSYFTEKIMLEELITLLTNLAEKAKEEFEAEMSRRKENLQSIDWEGLTFVFTEGYKHIPSSMVETTDEIFVSYDEGQECFTLTTNTNYQRLVSVSDSEFVHKNGFVAKSRKVGASIYELLNSYDYPLEVVVERDGVLLTFSETQSLKIKAEKDAAELASFKAGNPSFEEIVAFEAERAYDKIGGYESGSIAALEVEVQFLRKALKTSKEAVTTAYLGS